VDEKCPTLVRRVLLSGIAGAALGVLAGCASPGSPLPPSLKLPAVVTDLTATRVAGKVVLRWTTPPRTTDRLLIQGPVAAEICRDPVGSTAPPLTPAARNRGARPVPCKVVERVQARPGVSEAVDTLPTALTAATPGVLAYRVQLLNAAGRTAGPSAAVYAASGEAPEAVTGLKASSTKPGVVLEWTHPARPGDSVELARTLAKPAPGAAEPKPGQPQGLLPGTEVATESRFSAKETGGAIDRTAQAGATYRYTVERVRLVSFGGKTLQIHGEPSLPVEVAVQAVFAPDIPSGLVAAPAFSPENRPVIDLSWEPNVEPHVAGYKIYRTQTDDGWQLLTAQPVKTAAYRDAAVTAGQRYRYRVNAVNDAGMESTPSGEAAEMAPMP